MRTRSTTLGCALAVAISAGDARAADLSRGEDTDQVLCVAGCDSRVPVIVHERVRAPGQIDLPPPRTKWEHVTWGVYCADGIGCRAIGNIPFSRHRGSTSSTVHVHVHRHPY
jgi:hypothetical protein